MLLREHEMKKALLKWNHTRPGRPQVGNPLARP